MTGVDPAFSYTWRVLKIAREKYARCECGVGWVVQYDLSVLYPYGRWMAQGIQLTLDVELY